MDSILSSGNPSGLFLSSAFAFTASRRGWAFLLSLVVMGGFCANARASEKEPGTVPSAKTSAEAAREACILNQRNVQQAVRAYQHMRGLKEGDSIDWQNIIGKRGFMEANPLCPDRGEYRFAERIPAKGKLVLKCPKEHHEPDGHTDW